MPTDFTPSTETRPGTSRRVLLVLGCTIALAVGLTGCSAGVTDPGTRGASPTQPSSSSTSRTPAVASDGSKSATTSTGVLVPPVSIPPAAAHAA